MKITPEKMELSILRQMSQGNIPDSSYYEQLGATQEEFGSVVREMRDKNYIKGGSGSWEGPSGPTSSLHGARITMDGENYLSNQTEITEAYSNLEE